MQRLWSLLARLNGHTWQDIATAPCNCTIELAVIDGDVTALDCPYCRHDGEWLDATTMTPATVTATHWRRWQPDIIPACCC
ncbi:hypothetical protein [Bradyrhizobium jicamae]|uniref:hypothetical protein n=1 Tax=Bradyrhizobium jicamae TaxID=280332 RepID=UPI00201113F3|nr:hypothetical protein [Bradyrhizobium jicamae]